MTIAAPSGPALTYSSVDRVPRCAARFGPGTGRSRLRRRPQGMERRHRPPSRRSSRAAAASPTSSSSRGSPANTVPLSIRGGGHQVAGSAVCDDGLVIDLSSMTGCTSTRPPAPPACRPAHAGPTSTGPPSCSGWPPRAARSPITGVAGLTLGGGMGILHRAFGLACDNLRSIEIVTADGVVRTASRHEHPDLFWAARGGGRGLGVVTSFEFDLHPLGPDVAVAQVAYAFDRRAGDSAGVARPARERTRHGDGQAVLWVVPNHPQLPEALHDRHVRRRRRRLRRRPRRRRRGAGAVPITRPASARHERHVPVCPHPVGVRLRPPRRRPVLLEVALPR